MKIKPNKGTLSLESLVNKLVLLGFLSSRRGKPGSIIDTLSKEERMVLKDLTSKDLWRRIK